MMPKLKKNVAKTAKAAAATQAARTRDEIYPEVVADVCSDDTAITSDDAKHLLGWEEVPEGGGAYIKEIYALAKIRVRCANNVTNRPIYVGVLQTLRQEILRGRWRMNGEPIIIGKTGLILNGQHTLIALVLANLLWEADRDHWGEYWKTPPTIDKVVVSGVDEGDETVNTMDTCKPRSLTDVLYRSELFASMPAGERKVVARETDYAIRLLWLRTGAGLDAFAPRRTHAESLAFLAAHPKLLEAVRHVHEENGRDNKLGRYVNPGHAAGLLYLMGSSESDPEAYRASDQPDESSLDWSRWSQACDFFVLLASGGKETSALRKIMASVIAEAGLSNAERWAFIVNAWLAYSEGDPITEESLQLEYSIDKDGNRRLDLQPSVGGIDLGDPSTADEATLAMPDPKPEEIAEGAKKVRAKALKNMEEPPKAKPKSLGKPRRAGKAWAKGDVAWVKDADGDHYLGQISDGPWKCDDNTRMVLVVDAKGKEWEENVDNLSLSKPGQPAGKGKVTLFRVGQHAWVRCDDGEHWRGKIVEMSGAAARVTVGQGHRGCGTTRVVQVADLCSEQPGETDAA